MKSFRQLMRQPIKTLSGVILVAMAVAILCVCVGQAAAAANMRSSMEESYTTVALPTNKYLTGSIPEEALEWARQTVAENPDIVLHDFHAGLCSAYIEELCPDNTMNEAVLPSSVSESNLSLLSSMAAPYDQIMAEVTLTAVGQPEEDENGVTVELRGRIENVIGLQEGFADPTGFTAIMELSLPDLDSWETRKDEFVIGERYLTYGMDYYDRDWELRCYILSGKVDLPSGSPYTGGLFSGGFYIERFDLEYLTYIGGLTEDQWDRLGFILDGMYIGPYYIDPVAYYCQYYVTEEGKTDYRVIHFTACQMDGYFNKVSFTLNDYSQQTGVAQMPTIVKLEGSAEEFLASADGALWRSTLDAMAVNGQSFAVIGVDDLMYIGEFAKQNASIVEGRNFTQEELEKGSKVCVISRYLAEQNGLSVGDTITARFYDSVEDAPWQLHISEDQGVINPTAYYFTADSEFTGDGETYTIVGLYDQTYYWDVSAGNLYAFNPNTIFAPKTSISVEMEYSEMGMFRTLVLQNGTVRDFQRLQRLGGYESLFKCYDQGYTELSDNLYSYEAIGKQALNVGLVIYSIVLLLYFVLFPTRQGKTITAMASFGATRKDKLRHVNLSGLGILIPGTFIGLGAGILMRREVINALSRSAEVVLPLEMDVGSLVWVALLQLLLAAGLTFLLSIPMTRNRSLLKGRGLRRWFQKLQLNTWTVTAFALIVALVLCALNASNEAEIENYEKTRKEVTITVTVMDIYGDSSENLDLDTWVINMMSGAYDWGLSKYLTDVRIGFDLEVANINGSAADRDLRGILSVNAAPELLPSTNSSITWYEGYDESIFEGEELVCIVPAGYIADADPDTEAQELDLWFHAFSMEWVDFKEVSVESEYTLRLAVVGTYESAQNATAIYCPYKVADQARAKLRIGVRIDSASAILKNNEDLEEFRLMASRFFAEPDPDAQISTWFDYSLKIDTEALDKAEVVLNNSIIINRVSTFLVFVLSAGAGFFLGFLMIRSRKREIILMRTLGKPNAAIYRDYAWEQMLRVLLGVAVGGAVFLWQPLSRLGIFLLIYFVGLSAALILFLNSRLLTGVKEEE